MLPEAITVVLMMLQHTGVAILNGRVATASSAEAGRSGSPP
jgi:hypothetical protein